MRYTYIDNALVKKDKSMDYEMINYYKEDTGGKMYLYKIAIVEMIFLLLMEEMIKTSTICH